MLNLRVPTLSDLQTVFRKLESRDTEDMQFHMDVTNLEIPDTYSLDWLSFPKKEFRLCFSKITYKNKSKKEFRKFLNELIRVAPEVNVCGGSNNYERAIIERLMRKSHPENYPDREDFEEPPFFGDGDAYEFTGTEDFEVPPFAGAGDGAFNSVDVESEEALAGIMNSVTGNTAELEDDAELATLRFPLASAGAGTGEEKEEWER